MTNNARFLLNSFTKFEIYEKKGVIELSEKIIIETKNLTKFYGKIRGIENLNLKIYEGEIFGLLGPNGAGKTTAIRVLLDLIRRSSGPIPSRGDKHPPST